MEFKTSRIELTKKFIKDLKEINYWNKINRIFKKHYNKGHLNFTLKLDHLGLCDFIPDDEFKIEAYAKNYGYNIIDEEFHINKTIYHFERNGA